MAGGDPDGGAVVQVPLREAKACFSELVARADLLGQVTVLTKHGRPAAAIVPVGVGADVTDAQAAVVTLCGLLDRVCPPGQDPVVDDARALILPGGHGGVEAGMAPVGRLSR